MLDSCQQGVFSWILLDFVHQRHIALMQLTSKTLHNVLHSVSATDATTLRDGPNGWTTLEVVCHLRDFDAIFRQRAQQIVAEDYPHLMPQDHEAMVVDRHYNDDTLADVLATLDASRQETVAFFQSLTPAQWERAALHPSQGHFTLTHAVIQVGSHDVNHLEQITRILPQR